MLTAPTRWLLLEAGRRSIDVWLRAGQLSESGLKSDAHSAYNRMADEAPWPGEQANRAVLAFILLPWAALYTAMREHGRTEQEAVDSVIRAALAGAALERITTGLLLRTAHQRKVATTVRPGAAILELGITTRSRSSSPGCCFHGTHSSTSTPRASR